MVCEHDSIFAILFLTVRVKTNRVKTTGVRTPNLSPVSLTFVTTGKPKEYSTPEFTTTLRSISEHLFWGFVEKQTRYSKYRIAEPEKALLDWVYFTLQSGLTPRLDEIELKSLDKQKLVKYANKYPGTVRNALTNSLAFEHFAA
jgi:hypothetical protein